MKFKHIAIITVILLIFLIPISSASDVDLDSNNLNLTYDSSVESENINSISNSLNSVETNENSLSSNDLGSIETNENNLDSKNTEDSILSSNYLNAESNSTIRGPDIDTNFTQIKLNLNDSNTIYVNASYTGSNQNGTKLNPFTTISNGVSKIDSNFTNLFIANGVYSISSSIRLSKNITLIGENKEKTIIDGSGLTNIFKTSGTNVEINFINLTLRNSYNSLGSAIIVNKSTVNIINLQFINNKAVYSNDYAMGGAIYNDAGFLRIYNSTFTNNSALGPYATENFGGALYNHLGYLVIINSKFSNNLVNGTYGSGGAIYNYAGYLSVFNTSLTNNTIKSTYSLGGAISIWDSRNVYILNSTICGNQLNGSYTFASAISNKGTLIQIANSTIVNNSANGIGPKNSTVFNLNSIFYFNDNLYVNNTIKIVNESLILTLEDQLTVYDYFNQSDYENLPSSYDLRNLSLVTPVKNQNPSGACWAFATYSALESYLLKYENITYDFSENNMKDVMGNYSVNGTNWNDGGNHLVALAYLLRGDGPVNESDDPFSAKSTNPIYGLNITKHISDVLYIPLRKGYLDNNQIKAAVYKYGAVFTSLYSSIISRSYESAYSPIQYLATHALAIVGWDDNYSADNFNTKPPGDGAFIVKNSWGTYGGDNGYYYISYYDASLAAGIEAIGAFAFTNVENVTEYGNIYQHDIFGNTYESVGFNNDTAWMANQFTAVNYNPLKAFGFYTFGNSSYTVNITVNGKSVYTSSGKVYGSGYHTVKLNKLVNVKKGDIIKIILKLTTPNTIFPIAISTNYSSYSERQSSTWNQSFISRDGVNWIDLYNSSYTRVLKFYESSYAYRLNNATVCLKLYTDYEDDLYLDIESNSKNFTNNETINIKVFLTNEGSLSQDAYSYLNINNLGSIGSSSSSSGSGSSGSNNNGISLVNYTIKYYGNLTNLEESLENTTKTDYIRNLTGKTITNKSLSYFNSSNLVWYVNNIGGNEIYFLELNLLMNINKDLKINGSAKSSSKSAINTTANFNLSYLIKTTINGNNTFSTSARSYEILNFSLYTNDTNISGNNAIANKKIELSLIETDSGLKIQSVNLTSNNNGIIQYKLNLTLGYYKFRLSFKGDNVYREYTKDIIVNVSKRKETKLLYSDMITQSVITSVDGRVGEYFVVTLKDKDNYILANKLVQIGFNGKVYNKTTDGSGVAKLQINLKNPGTYTFAICFLSVDDYYASFNISKITVIKKKMSLTVPDKTYKSSNVNKYLTATLKDNLGSVVANKKISFTVNGKTYSTTTNSKGVTTVKVSLSKKTTYSFTVKFAGDTYYGAVTKSAKVTVK